MANDVEVGDFVKYHVNGNTGYCNVCQILQDTSEVRCYGIWEQSQSIARRRPYKGLTKHDSRTGFMPMKDITIIDKGKVKSWKEVMKDGC